MSELKVEIVSINNVVQHPNADRLDLVVIAGWNCVVGRGEFKPGDKAIYIPLDSILTPELEGKLFPIDSKIKLKNSRIRTIKIRGAVSQGIIIRPEAVGLGHLPVGTDVKSRMGISKYEPPEASVPAHMKFSGKRPKKKANPNFHKYTDISNYKHYNTLFESGEMVYVSEKLHGTSARYTWCLEAPNTLWKKIKAFLRGVFGIPAPYEFCFGSRNVQLQNRQYDGFYGENLYGKILEQEDIKWKLRAGEAVYGEIVGDAVQKKYTYGLGRGQHDFYVYDVMVDGCWLDYAKFVTFCDGRGLKRVPELYVGPYSASVVDTLRSGDSTIGGQKIREGVVIKPTIEKVSMVGRKVLKYVNDDYLLREDTTDFH